MSFDKSAGWDTAPVPLAAAGAPKRYIAEAISASNTRDGLQALQVTIDALTAKVGENSARTEIGMCAMKLKEMCEWLRASNVEATLVRITTALDDIHVTLKCIQAPPPKSEEDSGPGGPSGPGRPGESTKGSRK